MENQYFIVLFILPGLILGTLMLIVWAVKKIWKASDIKTGGIKT